MTVPSDHSDRSELDQLETEIRQALASHWQVLDGLGLEPWVMQRSMLELLAARVLQSRRKLELDEALDLLSQELDINSTILQPEHERLKDELSKILNQLDLDAGSPERMLTVIEVFEPDDPQERRSAGIFSLPDWLADSFASLAIPDEPLLCLDWGDSTLVPRLLLRWKEAETPGGEFATLDRAPETAETLRLMLSLVLDDLERIREAVQIGEAREEKSLDLFTTSSPGLGLRQFGTAFVNLLAAARNHPRYRTEQGQALPVMLSQRLASNGRAILLGPAGLLDGHTWARFREDLQARLQVEAIVDFSFDDRFVPHMAPITPSLVLARQPQQSVTRRVTLFAPNSPGDWGRAPDNPLEELITYLVGAGRPPQAGMVFERPTTELVDRWDPKFYCPARLDLQDRLINNPQATWLGGITQLITQGPPRSLLEPYVTTHLAGVSFEGRQETIAHLKVGDQVWLRREPDNPHDPYAVHVERRSGASLGYLPRELAADLAEALDELGGRLKAMVTSIHAGSSDYPQRGVTIQFPPPQYARAGGPVSVVRPNDITNNRLAGQGEPAWLLDEHQERVTRLGAGDILLYLRGFGKACVVPRELEGAVCHRDLAILRPKEDVDSLYLLAFILSAEFQEQLQFVARGVSIPSIDLADLEELLVILPPLATQRRIALAFAESQGELGAGLRANMEHWLDLLSDETVSRGRITSSLLSNLFSDWDQMHAIDDWLRLKSDYVRDLRDSVAHGRSPFQDESLDAVILALGMWVQAAERARRVPTGPVDVGQSYAELLERVLQVDHPFLSARLSSLVSKLAELWVAEPLPLPVRLSLEASALPVGVPSLLRLSLANQSEEVLTDLEVIPRLSSGETVERPDWRWPGLDPGETRSFEAYVRFTAPEVVRIECDISYAREDGDRVQQTIQLSLEAVPAEAFPFEPIQPNPYITGGAVDTPEMFFGRQDVLDFLSANLIGKHQSNVIILQGNRRTGKSSILKQVVNRDLFAPDIPVYVDCQGLGQLTDQSFFYKLARAIWRGLAGRKDVEAPLRVRREDFSEDDPFYDFQDVLDGLTAAVPSRRIILLIDEFEVIDMAIREGRLSRLVLENLRHLFQHRHDLAAVLTGSYRLSRLSQEYWSILFGLGLKRQVGFLDEGAARQLITKPLASLVTYSDEAVERILQLTACQPYFVQMVCHDLVNVLNDRKTTYVTQSDVEAAAQETLISADGHMRFMFRSADSRAWQALLVYMASSLSGPETLALHQIEGFVEGHRLSLNRAELEGALRELADRDILDIQGGMGQRRYGFKIDLVRQWIRRNYDLQSAIALAQSTAYVREE